MLNFVKGQENVFVVTLAQERTTAGVEYFIEFLHEQQRKVISATITDLSNFTDRYSKFAVDLPFVHIGDYEYKIWQDSSKENLIEVGKMHLTEPKTAPKTNEVNTFNNIINESE